LSKIIIQQNNFPIFFIQPIISIATMKARLLGLILTVETYGNNFTDALCQSACGLVDSADNCKRCVSQGDICLNLHRNQTDGVFFNEIPTSSYQAVTVEEAKALVVAEDNNCLAMFEKKNLLGSASYCQENNVCQNLYWDKLASVRNFSYLNPILGTGNAHINTASPVMCDYETAEKPHQIEYHQNEVDPCTALCHLGHSAAECFFVQREGSQCIRLFWTDASRTSTKFSVRAAAGTQIQVTVKEARDLLIPENHSCESLCNADPLCVTAGSFCAENRTCKDLFFSPGAPVRRDMKVCYHPHCLQDLTPVFCGYNIPEDVVETTGNPSAAATQESTGNENQTPANPVINAGASSDPSSSQLSAACLVSVVIALVITLI
jgi:hypothetical protein